MPQSVTFSLEAYTIIHILCQ